MERRSTRVSAAQWEIIIDFLTENPSLVRGYHNSSRGREQANRLWSRLADQLNAEGSGATKTAKEWATYFNNFKSKLKKLVADLNRESNSTGGGPAMAETLSEIERRVLSIMGPGFGQGLPSVRVNPFPNVGPTEPQDVAHERQEAQVLSVPVNLEIGSENWEHIQVEDEASGLQAGTSEAQVSPSILILPPSQPAPPPQPSVPSLERRTRRTRYRARPMAPLDEARRILSEIERQRAASDAATARAMHLIGENLGRIANALERYIGIRPGQGEDQGV